jgi:hypothetical protein
LDSNVVLLVCDAHGVAREKIFHSVRVSGRLKIAQRFIAGIGIIVRTQSVKLTAEKSSDTAVNFQPSAFTDFEYFLSLSQPRCIGAGLLSFVRFAD